MPTSLDSILTTAQNVVQAINGLAVTYLNVQGTSSVADIDAATLVRTGAGRLATVSITTAGSAAGAIYDASVATSTEREVFSIPNTLGVVFVNMPVRYGIVVAPGTGQVVAVSYS